MRTRCPAAIAASPRPWIERRRGECAFPVSGHGWRVRSCCNPCASETYCPSHAAIMRGPPAAPLDELEGILTALGVLD